MASVSVGGMFNVIDATSGWKVDLIHRKDRPFSHGSRRQLEDVATLLRVRREECDRVYVDRWVAALGLEGEWREARRQASP